MAIIPKYTLNEKFENGKKPPQWDFWAWQDSYWHKEEKIPTAAVEGLDDKLQKKADLIDGVVPEWQLPFSVVTSEVIALGKVEIVDNKVKLAVHSSGANKVRVKGKLITRAFPNEWSFTPIAGSGIKVLRGYAIKTSDDFFMREGAELNEMTDPEIPENALQLFRLTISALGVIIEEETEEVFKYRSDDAWRPLIINNNTGVWLNFGGTGASSFNITVAGSVSAPKIVGMSTKITKNIWNGKEILLYNDSDIDVSIVKDFPLPSSPNATFRNFAEAYILKPKSYNLIKQQGNQIVVVKYGGGSASFPTNGANGNPLVKDTTTPEGVKFSSAIPDAIALKADKPTGADGIFAYQKVGLIYSWVTVSTSNIGNSNLTLTSNRTLAQSTFTYTHSTNGKDYKITGLLPSLTPEKALVLTADKNVKEAAIVGFDEIYAGATNLTQQNLLDNYPTAKFVDAPNTTPPKVYYRLGLIWKVLTSNDVA